jgi:hypothetical protein
LSEVLRHAWYDIVVLIRVILVVCKIMAKNSDITSELEERFEDST